MMIKLVCVCMWKANLFDAIKSFVCHLLHLLFLCLLEELWRLGLTRQNMVSFFIQHILAEQVQKTRVESHGTWRISAPLRLVLTALQVWIWSLWYVVSISLLLWRWWLGGRKGIRPVKNWALGCWSEVQTFIWPSWCYCHSLSLASVKSWLVLPFWYRLTRVVPDKGPLNGSVCDTLYY